MRTMHTILEEWINDYATDYGVEHESDFETYIRDSIPANKAMGGMQARLNVPEAERILVFLEALKKESISYD